MNKYNLLVVPTTNTQFAYLSATLQGISCCKDHSLRFIISVASYTLTIPSAEHVANIKPKWRGANLTSVTDVLESTREVLLTQLWLLLWPPTAVPPELSVFSLALKAFCLSDDDIWGEPPATSSHIAAVRSKEHVAITYKTEYYATHA